ncbi:hypothetical protein D1AOALGA4SA_7186 [Olavius algarvensis Delta 1 endosymbiont]|nr:hypothetical protein D1AOALGA4SA_7186 [Olavius algarvensis Delta 1 endosymbiont]
MSASRRPKRRHAFSRKIIVSCSSVIKNLSTFIIEWTHKRKNSHYISMIR